MVEQKMFSISIQKSFGFAIIYEFEFNSLYISILFINFVFNYTGEFGIDFQNYL